MLSDALEILFNLGCKLYALCLCFFSGEHPAITELGCLWISVLIGPPHFPGVSQATVNFISTLNQVRLYKLNLNGTFFFWPAPPILQKILTILLTLRPN